MVEGIVYPVSFENLLRYVAKEKNGVPHFRKSIFDNLSEETQSVNPVEDNMRAVGHPTSNMVCFLVDFMASWDKLSEISRTTTIRSLEKVYAFIRNPFRIEANLNEEEKAAICKRLSKFKYTNELAHIVSLFNSKTGYTIIPRLKEVDDMISDNVFGDIKKYDKRLLRDGSEKEVVKFDVRNEKAITEGFEQTNRGFKVMDERVDGLALMMTTKIMESREQILEMRKQIEENRMTALRNTKAWERMEEDLGKKIDKIEEYTDEIKSKLYEYETGEMTVDRWRKDYAYRREWWFTQELLVSKEWQTNVENREKRDKIKEEKRKKEREWEDAYFNGDFGKIGYRYIPYYCLFRPVGIVLEEKDMWEWGEGRVYYGRLSIALSVLSVYLYSFLKLGFLVGRWSWNKIVLILSGSIIEKIMDKIKDKMSRGLITGHEDDELRERRRWIKIGGGSLMAGIGLYYLLKRLLGRFKRQDIIVIEDSEIRSIGNDSSENSSG